MNSGTREEKVGRMIKLTGSAIELVAQGKREPDDLNDFLQKFVFGNALPDLDWQKTYDTLGMSAEYAEAIKTLGVHENPNLWVVPAVKGVTCNKVVAALRSLDGIYTYVDDLNKDVPTNDRDPNRDGSYAISFLRTIEADEENKNKSANVLAQGGHKGITLLERLLMELGYFLTTGQHLDVKNITLCAGSRDSDGNVPGVYGSSGARGVYVGCCSSGHAGGSLRSRSVVS